MQDPVDYASGQLLGKACLEYQRIAINDAGRNKHLGIATAQFKGNHVGQAVFSEELPIKPSYNVIFNKIQI